MTIKQNRDSSKQSEDATHELGSAKTRKPVYVKADIQHRKNIPEELWDKVTLKRWAGRRGSLATSGRYVEDINTVTGRRKYWYLGVEFKKIPGEETYAFRGKHGSLGYICSMIEKELGVHK